MECSLSFRLALAWLPLCAAQSHLQKMQGPKTLSPAPGPQAHSQTRGGPQAAPQRPLKQQLAEAVWSCCNAHP